MTAGTDRFRHGSTPPLSSRTVLGEDKSCRPVCVRATPRSLRVPRTISARLGFARRAAKETSWGRMVQYFRCGPRLGSASRIFRRCRVGRSRPRSSRLDMVAHQGDQLARGAEHQRPSIAYGGRCSRSTERAGSLYPQRRGAVAHSSECLLPVAALTPTVAQRQQIPRYSSGAYSTRRCRRSWNVTASTFKDRSLLTASRGLVIVRL